MLFLSLLVDLTVLTNASWTTAPVPGSPAHPPLVVTGTGLFGFVSEPPRVFPVLGPARFMIAPILVATVGCQVEPANAQTTPAPTRTLYKHLKPSPRDKSARQASITSKRRNAT